MKSRLKTLLQFSIFWLLFFILGKIIFTLLNYSSIENFSLIPSLQSLFYGLKLDISFLGYTLVIPFFLFLIDSLGPNRLYQQIFKYYSYLLIFFFSLFIVVDAALYQHWGIKLDIEPLKYINKPSLILGNLSYTTLIFQISIWIILVIVSIFIFNKAKIE